MENGIRRKSSAAVVSCARPARFGWHTDALFWLEILTSHSGMEGAYQGRDRSFEMLARCVVAFLIIALAGCSEDDSSSNNDAGGAASGGTGGGGAGSSGGGGAGAGGSSAGAGGSGSVTCGDEMCSADEYCRAGCNGTGGPPGPPRCWPLPAECVGNATCDCICGPTSLFCTPGAPEIQCGCG